MKSKLSAVAFTFSLFVFILAGLAAFLDHQGFSLRLFIFSFLLIFLGLITYLWEIKSEK